ncbi:MAG TPA: serine/threonine-protein kinase [Pirellulaceae bacterium]|nr:serine/threonine-protein kinase [Pirellulaceae bacterium]
MDSHEGTISAGPASTDVPAVEGEPDSTLEDAKVARILDDYLADLERGRPVDPQRLLAEHPAIARRLRACLSGLSLLEEGTSPGTKLTAGAFPELAGYQIVREIGRGGMGIVYEAVQDSPQRRVALKVLPFAAALDPRQRLRFQNEAQAAARLRHPHIVPVYDSGSAGGVHYFTMKLIEGASLSAVVAAQRRRGSSRGREHNTADLPTSSPLARLPHCDPQYVREVARLMRQAAEALDHAHAIGIIHRDIKPGNLLVDEGGQLWITDFGLAAVQGSEGLTATGDILGTLRYMSPEQASARRGVVDHRSDIYALGVTMYELLTLQPAVRGEDREQLLARLSHDEPPLPRQWNPAIDYDLETILLKAMAKAPEERFATAQSLAEDLERFLTGRPVHARRPGLLARGAKWVRRHKAAATAGVMVTLTAALLLAVSTGVIWLALRAEQRQRALADARELESRRHRYAAQMNLAMQEWHAGNVAKVHDLLAQNAPRPGERDLREFEWHHLWRLCQHARRGTLDGGSGPIRAVAVAADGKLWAAGNEEGSIHLWDAVTGKLRFTIPSLGAPLRSLAISPDGERMAASTGDGHVRLWELTTQRLLSAGGQGNTDAPALAFSPDGEALYVAGNVHPLGIYSGRTGEFRQLHGEGVYSPNCLAVSADGRQIATAGNDRAVVLWDVSASPPAAEAIGSHRTYVLCLAFSPGGETLVSGSEDGQVILWDTAARTARKTLRRHTGAVIGVAFSPAGDRIASVSWDGSVKLWDAASGELVLQQGHAGQASSVAFTADGKSLLTGGDDGQVAIWDLAAPAEPLVLKGHQRWIRSLAFSRDNRSLAVASADGTASLWRLRELVERIVLQAENRTERPSWMARNNVDDPDRLMGIVFSSGDQRVIAADYGGRIRGWDLRDPFDRVLFEPAEGPVWSLAISVDGTTLAAAGYTSNAIVLWDVASGTKKSVLRGHGERVWSVVFSPDGKTVASAANDRTIRLWDVVSGKERLAIPLPASFPFALAWSPDGTRLAVSGDDRLVRLWDVGTRRELARFGQHPAAVRSLAYFPDGRTLASGSDDGTVRLWDLATGQERASLRIPGSSVWSVAVSPDGQTIAAGDGDGTIIVWRASKLAEPQPAIVGKQHGR